MKAEMENGMTEAADNYSKLVGGRKFGFYLNPFFSYFFALHEALTTGEFRTTTSWNVIIFRNRNESFSLDIERD